MVQPMFGRVPSEDCNHSKNGVCSKCILEQTYNLSGPSTPLKIPPAAGGYAVTNHAETPTSTPILDFFQLRNGSQSSNGPTTYLPSAEGHAAKHHASPSTSSTSPPFSLDPAHSLPTDAVCDEQPRSVVRSPAVAGRSPSPPTALSAPSSADSSPLKFVAREGSEHPRDSVDSSSSSVGPPPAMPPIAEGGSRVVVQKVTTALVNDGTVEAAVELTERWDAKLGSLDDDVEEDYTFTSFASLNRQFHRRITEEEGEIELDDNEEGANGLLQTTTAQQVVILNGRTVEKPKESLLRLFESEFFNVPIALQYLYKSNDPTVILYLGNRLRRFPTDEVDFFIPQLIALYINNSNVASGIHSYIIDRCKESIEFSLECYWLLEAYGVEQFKTHHKRAQGFFLRETIFNEYMRSKHQRRGKGSTPAAAAALHHRSRSDARVDESPESDEPADGSPPPPEANGLPKSHSSPVMKRTESSRSVRSISNPANLSSGHAFDNSCRCFNEQNGETTDVLEVECTCGADQKTRPELEFVNALIAIGNRLKEIQPRHEKSKRLIYELFLLNLNFPARVWLPLYADRSSHLLVRIPHTEGCVLNSKDKAPYCIYCEVVEVDNVSTCELPAKEVETGETTIQAPLLPPVVNVTTPNGNALVNSFGPSLSPVEEMAAAAVERALSRNDLAASSSEPVLNDAGIPDDQLIHFDRIIDETRSMADSDEVYSQFSDEPDFNDKPLSKLDKIRLRLARLKRRRKPGIAHTADDPSASAMSEPWEEKQRRIQSASPYGHLPGWRLLPVIIKTGDDLRQELLAYQLLTTLQNIWKDEGVNLLLRPYKILVCSHDSGMIEPIPNACSLHQIKKNLCSKPNLDDAGQPYVPTLLSHFLINYGSRLSESFQQAQQNFIRSCAAYSLACYFLQVKDRHNGNILLDSEGYLIHIDFGFILSISPKNLGFETSPFKLTQELIDVMGGPNSEMFATFRELIFRGMIAARKHHERILNIVEIMSHGSQLPCFRASGSAAVRLLRERFHLGCTEQQLRTIVNSLIEQSRDSLTTRLYDSFQYYTNAIQF
ncbi:Phosphatidylinositol 4-kinase beta [Aphelenchoides fujianensis]|nr:Phosphatidylinositol 4-kinase beta [Aphelenchoides fujianensis]